MLQTQNLENVSKNLQCHFQACGCVDPYNPHFPVCVQHDPQANINYEMIETAEYRPC